MRIDKVKETFREQAKDTLLDLLRDAEYPISRPELSKGLSNILGAPFNLDKLLLELRSKGYDIREILGKGEARIYLSTTSQRGTTDYETMGHIKTPVLFTSDWHIGSKGWSEEAWKHLVSDIKRYKIRDVLHTGDLIQCLGVYSKELKDLSLYDMDTQMDTTISYLEPIVRRVPIHIVMGGHEEVLKGKKDVGFDFLKAISKRLPNFRYYGDRMDLRLNNEYLVTGLHSAGSSLSVSSPSKIERIWKELDTKPDILAVGHNHRLYLLTKGKKILLETGSLQRETSLVSQRGISSTLGWWILKGFNREEVNIIKRTPEV